MVDATLPGAGPGEQSLILRVHPKRKRSGVHLEARVRKVADREDARVYFLFRDGRLVYIGSTTRLPMRLEAHRASGKAFDSYASFPVPKLQMLDIESALISWFLPDLNLSVPSSNLTVANAIRTMTFYAAEMERELITCHLDLALFDEAPIHPDRMDCDP